MCVFFIIQYLEFGCKLFYISTQQTHEYFKLFLYIYPFFLQQHFYISKNNFKYLLTSNDMIYLFILLLNFFLNGSSCHIFVQCPTCIFSECHIQYPVIAFYCPMSSYRSYKFFHSPCYIRYVIPFLFLLFSIFF